VSILNVTSEVGRLKQVLVHEPGAEIDAMVPDMMDELLFEDILHGETARKEHRTFVRVLEALGVEVLEASNILTETLAHPDARGWVTSALLTAVPKPVRDRLHDANPELLARLLVKGIRREDSAHHLDPDELFDITPIPNWCFQRDPQVVLGDGVIVSSMATPARWREALMSSTIFRFHPRLSAAHMYADPTEGSAWRPIHLGFNRPRYEGGDILVLSKDVMAIGYSERTNRTGVQELARALHEARRRKLNVPRHVIIVAIPHRRAFMHLDTIFTPIDHDACLVYPPALQPSSPDSVDVFDLDLDQEVFQPAPKSDLLSALRERGLDYEAIPCGGNDVIHQQREQWTDGANAFAAAPGLIFLYDRNPFTADALRARGFDVIDAETAIVRGESLIGKRVVVLLESHELSRARGGPHCLTHPLVRE
jgi:arginine deiminase